MNAEQIREYIEQHIQGGNLPQDLAAFRMLGEIAAQFAEYNERAARQEPTALKIAKKSLAMMERTEKACAALEKKERKGERGASQS